MNWIEDYKLQVLNNMDKSTEAPVSMTFSVQTEKGFPVLFTVRGEKYLEAIKNIQTIETALISAKCIPQVKTFGGKPAFKTEPEDTKECPIHGGIMMKARQGKYGKFYSHNLNGVWCSGKENTL